MAAGLPLRSVVWLRAADDAAAAAAASSTVDPATAGQPAGQEVNPQPPALFVAMAAASGTSGWGTLLGGVAVLEVAVGGTGQLSDGSGFGDSCPSGAAGLFSCPPAGGDVVSSPWANRETGTIAPIAAVPPHAPPAGAAKPPAAAAKAGGKVATVAAAAAPEVPPEQVPGVVELARALLTVAACAAVYDAWKASATVMPLVRLLPQADERLMQRLGLSEPSGCRADSPSIASMSRYASVLECVPPERQTVPLLLAAMVEQVACSCACPEDVAEAEQENALQAAAAAIDAAFTALGPEDGRAAAWGVAAPLEQLQPQLAMLLEVRTACCTRERPH